MDTGLCIGGETTSKTFFSVADSTDWYPVGLYIYNIYIMFFETYPIDIDHHILAISREISPTFVSRKTRSSDYVMFFYHTQVHAMST